MSLRQPPRIPSEQLIAVELRPFFVELDKWMNDVYSKLRFIDLKDSSFSTSTTAPSGGQDGDLHVRKSGASTALYINKNGTWSAYNNP